MVSHAAEPFSELSSEFRTYSDDDDDDDNDTQVYL